MKISVLGCGRWGTYLASYLTSIDHEVLLWGREESRNLNSLTKNRKNEYITIPSELELTSNLKNALDFGEYIIISINAQNLQNLMDNIGKVKKNFILCMKGIDILTTKRLSEIVQENQPKSKIAVWVGPGHIQNFEKGTPNCMVIDSNELAYTTQIVKDLSSHLIRLYIGTDLIGSEIGAASKNVFGIAAGFLDAVGYATLKGGLMARGSREVARLIKSMGGDELSAYGLCHLGDYEATLFSEYSHNRKFGYAFIKNEPFDKLAEGVYTTQALIKLSKKHNVDMPITKAVDDIINHGKDAKKVLSNLFLREIKIEFE